MKRFAAVCGLALLSAAPGLLAQTTAVLEGFVFDPSGSAVPAAEVRIVEQDTNAIRDGASNDVGRFEARGLPPGRYRIAVSRPGFRTAVRADVVLGSGRNLRVDFHLELGEAREEIVVSGQAALVSVSVADWGNSVTTERLESLPLNGRDLYDLAAQQPGATGPTSSDANMLSGMGSHLSVNGARPNQNAFRIDGIYVNDATNSSPSSASGALLGLESVQELRLVTSPFSAEYGVAVGGIFTAVSRSATNRMHGSAYEYARNSALDAKNFFDSPNDDIPTLRKNQFGASLGGPLRRDKLFLLGNYEGVRQSSGRTLRPTTLSADGRAGRLPGSVANVAASVLPYLNLYPVANGRDFGDGTAEFVNAVTAGTSEDFASAKLDFVHSERARVSARYSFDNTHVETPDDFSVWNLTSDSRFQFLHTEAQFAASPQTVTVFRAGFSRIRNDDEAAALAGGLSSLTFYPGRTMGALQVGGLTDMGNSLYRTRPRSYVTNAFQLSWEGTHVHGPQTWRFGAGMIRQQFNQVSGNNPNGLYRFDSVADLLAGRPQSADTQAPGSDIARGWRQSHLFGYVQDEIWITRRLQLSLGVRYETYSTPSEVNGKTATLKDPIHDSQLVVGGPLFQNPSRLNFGPRAALAWDPFGSGTTVIRAGSGIFFDELGSREIQISGVRLPPFYTRLRPKNPVFPNLLQAVQNTSSLPVLDVVDYYVNQPYVLQFQFAVNRQFGRTWAAETAYSGSRGVHLMGRVGSTNTPAPQFQPDGRVFFPANAPRINPSFDQIDRHRTQFNSFYHGLHASLTRQFNAGVRLQVKYSWSKSLDEVSTPATTDFLNSDRMPQLYNYRANRGPSDFDVRHVFALNFSWVLGGATWSGAAGALLGGWELHGLSQAQTGSPFSPFIGFDRARFGTTSTSQRPDLIAPLGSRIILGDPQQWFDPHAFGLPEAGYLGNLGRNVLTGPGLVTIDLALHKVLWKTDRQQVRLRLEGFNVANRPNFQIPSSLDVFSTAGYLGGAGRITATTTSSRQVQIALRWAF